MENRPWKSEAEHQAFAFKWFDREYPNQRGRLILIYNNPPNAIVGSMLKSMGMRRGTSDYLYFLFEARRIAFIEFKVGYNKQDTPQEEFEDMVEALGFEYYLVTSKVYGDISEFINLIKTLNNGR